MIWTEMLIQVEIGRKEVVVEDGGALTMENLKLREMSPSDMKGSGKIPWRSSSSVSVSIVSPVRDDLVRVVAHGAGTTSSLRLGDG